MPNIKLPGNLGIVKIPLKPQKPCSAKQWNDGILAVSSTALSRVPSHTSFSDIPVGVVPDGNGGVFLLTGENSRWLGSTQGPFVLQPVSAAGKPASQVYFGDPRSWIGVAGWWTEGALVPSGAGRCIVVWDWKMSGIVAQRYDQSAYPLWGPKIKASVLVSSKTSNSIAPINLVAEPDGQDGAIVGWLGLLGGTPNATIELQRISAAGKMLWGNNGISFGTANVPTSGLPPGPWMQLISDGNGGAHVIVPQDVPWRGINYVVYKIDAQGAVSAPVTLVTNVVDGWIAYQRVRRAIPDGTGGFYLAYTLKTGELHVLRYSSANAISWDIALGRAIHPWAFHVREDERGGSLVGFVSASPTPRVELMRIEPSGAISWNINSVALGTLIPVGIPAGSSSFRNEKWSRLAQPVPVTGGGTILIFQNDEDGSGTLKLFSVCFDSSGVMVAPIQRVSSNAGVQEFPLVTSAHEAAIVAWADDMRASTHSLDVYAQRVGCCPPVGLEPLPRFGCEIIQFPGLGFQEMELRLPCGNNKRQIGVIPLTRFFTCVRGLDYPGSIMNRDVAPPDWLRINFLGIPESIQVQLCSMKGQLVAQGRPVGRAKSTSGPTNAQVLTFRPSAKEDQLLVFSSTKSEPGSSYLLRVTSEWGHGTPAPFLKTARNSKAARNRGRRTETNRLHRLNR